MQIQYKIFYRGLLALLVFGLSFSGCKKIEIAPIGQVDADLAVRNEADVKAILNATYTPLRGDQFYGGRQQIISELMADMVNGKEFTGDYNTLYNFASGSSTGTATGFYNEGYLIIQRANVALSNLDKVTSSDAAKNDVEGQAKFIRALAHFELVRLFAQPYGFTLGNTHLGIIIKTNSEMEIGRSRNTVKEVYDQIIADLMSAESLLPATNGNYPGSIAAKALLARVYFQMNSFAEAYNYSNQVLTILGPGKFNISFNSYGSRISPTYNSENIFWLVNEPGLITMGALRNPTNPEISLGLPITKEAYDEARLNAVGDRRFSFWYKDSLNSSTNTHTYSIRKYNKPDFILPVIQVTEMMLTRAESAAELNQNLAVAISDINLITNRAYDGNLAPLPSTATAAQIKARVRTERKREMVFEVGDRLQQIKRIGAKGETSVSRTAPWNCNGMILQFPTNEITVNKNFIQNPTGGCN